MAGITGQGTTFNLPNYTGELFAVSPQDTSFLSAIGGLTGGESVDSERFDWETYDLRTPDAVRQRLEGANAPTAEARVRGHVSNVVEIHQEALELTYSKQAATGMLAGSGSNHPNAGSLTGTNPVLDEVNWQLHQHLIQIARDVETTFINGTFQEPANNSTTRRTRGLLEAIVTNKKAAGNAALSADLILDVMQEVWESGGIMVDETRTLLCAGYQKRALTTEFVSKDIYRQDSRTVGGVSVDTILTDFGRVNVMLNRYVPIDTVIIASLEQCAPKFLAIPGKGHFFTEPLAKQGSADRFQLYGEIGLAYGNEIAHGKLTGLSSLPAAS
jgi:hypothetical protein